jgi:hypothetical protein
MYWYEFDNNPRALETLLTVIARFDGVDGDSG